MKPYPKLANSQIFRDINQDEPLKPEKIPEGQLKDKPIYIAVDFDGTIADTCDSLQLMHNEVPMDSTCPKDDVKEVLRDFRNRGWKIIINTVRDDNDAILKWMKQQGIPFDYINHNPDQPTTSPKIDCEAYIDNRSVSARKPWREIAQETIELVELSEKKNKSLSIYISKSADKPKFTGTETDKLGRTICFSEGVHVPCEPVTGVSNGQSRVGKPEAVLEGVGEGGSAGGSGGGEPGGEPGPELEPAGGTELGVPGSPNDTGFDSASKIITTRPEFTKPGNTDLVPEGIRKFLRPHALQAAAKAIEAIDKYGGFLLASGTGAGKTRSELAVAQTYAAQGFKVLIVSPRQVINPDKLGNPTGSFKDDSDAMGIKLKMNNGTADLLPGEVNLMTYQGIKGFVTKVGKKFEAPKIDENTVVIFDESHMGKNAWSGFAKAMQAISEKARGVMYATATPADQPMHIAHLFRAKIFGSLGMKKTFKKIGLVKSNGQWVCAPGFTHAEVRRRMSGLFDRMTLDGLMIKHELSFKGVTVDVNQIKLPESVHKMMDEIEKAVKSKGMVNKGLEKAQILFQQRWQQEPYKIPHAVKMVQDELAEGRSAIIFMSRVNPSQTKDGGGEVITSSDGTVKLLREQLNKLGIHDISEIHGGNKKGIPEAMANFQSGKNRVVIATVESGGTGINLDDVVGNHPRSMIMMTPPFSANSIVQALGRGWRLNTKSDFRAKFLFGDTDVDTWNGHLAAKKLGMLNATVSGGLSKLAMTPEDVEKAGADVMDPDADDYNEPYEWPSLVGPDAAKSYLMPFGKHQGKPITSVPKDYLQWLNNQPNIKGDLKIHLNSVLSGNSTKVTPSKGSIPGTSANDPSKVIQPSFVSKNPALTVPNNQAVKELLALAMKGDAEGLANHPGTASSKVQGYKTALMHALANKMKAEANPPPASTTPHTSPIPDAPPPIAPFTPKIITLQDNAPEDTYQMDDEQKQYIHAALKQMAASDGDKAKEKNSVGFNQQDSDIGHKLANSANLTDKQAIHAAHMLRKYKKQMHPAMYVMATSLQKNPSTGPKPVDITIKQVITKNGPKLIHSFEPGKGFWNKWKQWKDGIGEKPAYVTVVKDKDTGKFKATVWANHEEELKSRILSLWDMGAKSFGWYLTKGTGETCSPGERSDESGCTPASGKVGNAPTVESNLPDDKTWKNELKKLWDKYGEDDEDLGGFEDQGGWGLCGAASKLLHSQLEKNGIQTKLAYGSYDDGSEGGSGEHYWLETNDGTIIDSVESQFRPEVPLGKITVHPKDSEESKKYHLFRFEQGKKSISIGDREVKEDQPFDNYHDAKRISEKCRKKFKDGLKEAANGFKYKVASIKSRLSFVDKTEVRGKEPDKVTDVLRGAIIVKHKDEMSDVVSRLKKIFKVLRIDAKNEPTELLGYYGAIHLDIAIPIEKESEKDLICEIQIMPKSVWRAKKRTDKSYKKYRSHAEIPSNDELERAKVLFKEANEKSLPWGVRTKFMHGLIKELPVEYKAMREEPKEYKYGVLMLILPDAIRKEITDWTTENIPEYALGADGRELRPHITIKYGFDSKNPEDTIETIKEIVDDMRGPIEIKLGSPAMFKAGKDVVPLYLPVESPQIIELNSAISSVFPIKDKFESYHPHVTLAFIGEDFSEQYSAVSVPFAGKMVNADLIEFRSADKETTVIPLKISGFFGLTKSISEEIVVETKSLPIPKITITDKIVDILAITRRAKELTRNGSSIVRK